MHVDLLSHDFAKGPKCDPIFTACVCSDQFDLQRSGRGDWAL